MTQVKTGTLLVLPLLPEIKTALDCYLLERETSNGSKYIFLRDSAPFLPLSRSAIWSITAKYFNLAGVNTTAKKHGPHSLRSSFASSLIRENVPYSVIQKILGHEDPNSTKHYYGKQNIMASNIDKSPKTGDLPVCLLYIIISVPMNLTIPSNHHYHSSLSF